MARPAFLRVFSVMAPATLAFVACSTSDAPHGRANEAVSATEPAPAIVAEGRQASLAALHVIAALERLPSIAHRSKPSAQSSAKSSAESSLTRVDSAVVIGRVRADLPIRATG